MLSDVVIVPRVPFVTEISSTVKSVVGSLVVKVIFTTSSFITEEPLVIADEETDPIPETVIVGEVGSNVQLIVLLAVLSLPPTS